MLETKELCKVYRPKKGVPVVALDKVSLKFPQKGMIFLLGKSGSGKSTLLNLLGGLDKYDSGDILIRGQSSKTFDQKSFDSYRNTYVGFIFQEYNVLDEFTVGANIALAIELQNRRATDSQINEILETVDLAGYGARKPNELSGGQKQRVAIARALVKNPDIIMADEPTGALDSNTGRQVFQTLKKLSNDKLVIVVSHDREFAECYADRIIELSDGKVISDMELDNENANEGSLIFEEDSIIIPPEYHLTEDDRRMINEYIKANDKATRLTIGNSRRFKKTDQTVLKSYEGGFKLIRSRLPMKTAFKIGSQSLRYKKFRLVLTILLSCISFGLFGLADTFGAYDHVNTCTNSIIDSQVQYASVGKSKKVGKGDDSYWRDWGYTLDEAELKTIEEGSSVKLQGVYVPRNSNLDFSAQTDQSVELTQTDFTVHCTNFNGFTEITEKRMKELGFTLIAGRLPSGDNNEIAVSEYTFEVFNKTKYYDGKTTQKDTQGNNVPVYEEITAAQQLLGKNIYLDGKTYTVTAVIDTGFNLERYISLTEEDKNASEAETLIKYALFKEFSHAINYSLSSSVMLGEGAIEKMIIESTQVYPITNGYLNWLEQKNYSFDVDPAYLTSLGHVESDKIIWIDGKRDKLAENEIIASTDAINIWDEDIFLYNADGGIDYTAIVAKYNVITLSGFNFNINKNIEQADYKIVGLIDSEKNREYTSTVVANDALYNYYTEDGTGPYSFAVGAMPQGRDEVKRLVKFCYSEDNGICFPINNSVTYELDMVNETLKRLSKYLLYIGIGFAVFSALMLSNFIATSISYKKQEIGILRAIGSRSNDVFRIFFSESFIIAMINFVLSALGVGIVTYVINMLLRLNTGILITILDFSLRQVILLFFVSMLVAFLASYIPVKRIASKRPIDAIREK